MYTRQYITTIFRKGLEMNKDIKLPHIHNKRTLEILEIIPKDEQFIKTAETFKLISDPTRTKILWILCHTEECVSNIAASIDMSLPAVSHHLKLLRQSGIIVSRKEGQEVFYTLADAEKAHVLHMAIDAISEGKVSEILSKHREKPEL